MNIPALGKIFVLENSEKATRAVEGTMDRLGQLKGGVGIERDGDGEITNGLAILAAYDKFAGLITLNGDRVLTGCFWDFKGRQPTAEPKIILQFNINGKEVTIPADQALPPLVQAAKAAENPDSQQEVVDEEESPQRRSTTLIGSGKRAHKVE